MRHTTQSPIENSPVHAARVAIWQLFQDGFVDEDIATAGLLAVDLGARRKSPSVRLGRELKHDREAEVYPLGPSGLAEPAAAEPMPTA